MPLHIRKAGEAEECLALRSALQLGITTHVANHHPSEYGKPDGSTGLKLLRDSDGCPGKKRKTAKLNPWQQLILTTSRLSLGQARQSRQLHADLTHTAMFPNPFPDEFKEAVETTAATKGTDRRQAAKATWMSLCKGILASKRKLPDFSLAALRQHFAAKKPLDEKVIECKAAITHDQTMMLLSWWLHGLDDIEEAFQEIVVALGADVKHGPAPAYGMERDTADALAAVMGHLNDTAAASTEMW
jgi:hypothetical protein